MTYPVGPLRGRLSGRKGMTGRLSIGTSGSAPAYDGPYEATPTRETQTLSTAGKQCSENIVINPIPPEYGFVSYDGSVLTIS